MMYFHICILFSVKNIHSNVSVSSSKTIPIISASIISKKVAETLDSLVLDVKIGKGAFLKDEKSARELASRMVNHFHV